ncbi:MAG TPA: MBL fold metallo-hydrolase [Aliidongia sp.]|nr:MBL fold metallo-hydrolase [Aliidongia sp.]
MSFRIAERWFEFETMGDGITLIWEPHVIPLMRCNIWHVRGRDRDLMIDTGMGIASLEAAARHLFDKQLTAVATHTHLDHVGSHHEFADRIAHPIEAPRLATPGKVSLKRDDYPAAFVASIEEAGYEMPPFYITALPHEGYDLDSYRQLPAPVTGTVEEGDVIDLGDRVFEVLHLPGHSPGSIGLWEKSTGILFSGDAIYDGPLLDGGSDGDIPAYIKTMHRLAEMPVRVVHAGHDPSFDRDRLKELTRKYLDRRERR